MDRIGIFAALALVYGTGLLAGILCMRGSRKNWKKTVLWKSRFREYTAERQLKEQARAMGKLAAAFRESGSSSYERVAREIAATALAETAEKVCEACGGCHLGKMPLQRDAYYLQYLMHSFTKNGRVDCQDMPRVFSDTCCESELYMEELNQGLERGQKQMDWKARFLECREAVAAQFGEMEALLEGLASQEGERQDVTDQWEPALRKECRRLGLVLNRCFVEEAEDGSRQVHLQAQAAGRHGIPAREVAEAIGRRMKRELRLEVGSKSVVGKENSRLVLTEEPAYGVCYGIARAVKSGSDISGDNYSAMELPGGRYLLCLSDGMGSGRLASSESEAVVELAEQLAEAGFSLENMVKMMNSVLLLREGEQRPATLDLHCLNLHTGELRSRKQGAAATFLKQGEQVALLESSDAPIGWNPSLASEEQVHALGGEATLVLVTDGVVEALPGTEKEEFLVEILRRMKEGTPQSMAEDILSLAAGQEPPRDDMTVLVAQVARRGV